VYQHDLSPVATKHCLIAVGCQSSKLKLVDALRFNKVLMDGKLDGKNRFSTNTFIKLNNS
jgi:hypothetical protein